MVGIRRQESAGRRKAPVAKRQSALDMPSLKTGGYNWNSIIEWSEDEVYGFLEEKRFPLHEAYTVYGSSRVSCSFCILQSIDDQRASVRCPDNQSNYRALVDLEAVSTFSFSDRWLADLAPDLLDASTREAISRAKESARIREAAEDRIPEHLLYKKGWPEIMPTPAEADLLWEVRNTVAKAVAIEILHADPWAIQQRYSQLMAENSGRLTRRLQSNRQKKSNVPQLTK